MAEEAHNSCQAIGLLLVTGRIGGIFPDFAGFCLESTIDIVHTAYVVG